MAQVCIQISLGLLRRHLKLKLQPDDSHFIANIKTSVLFLDTRMMAGFPQSCASSLKEVGALGILQAEVNRYLCFPPGTPLTPCR